MTGKEINNVLEAFAKGLVRNGVPAAAVKAAIEETRLDQLADEAITAITRAEAAIDTLKEERDLLVSLLAKAADVPALVEQAEQKVAMLTLWRSSIDQIDRGLIALGRKP